jgi:putative ABC transport system substrate-binding protein
LFLPALVIRSFAGLVASFNRPQGNVTGVSLLGPDLEGKRLYLLHELISGSTPIRVLVNPAADLQLQELRETAGAIKRQIDIARASTALDI